MPSNPKVTKAIQRYLKSHEIVDASILGAIADEKDTFVSIWLTVYRKELWKAEKEVPRPEGERDWDLSEPFFRHVDRRIQSLRKKGLVAFEKKRWSLA